MGTFGPADIIRTFEFELNAKLRRGRPSLLPTPCESHRNMPPEKATVGVTMAVSVASDRSAPKDEHRHFIVSEATRGKSPDFLAPNSSFARAGRQKSRSRFIHFFPPGGRRAAARPGPAYGSRSHMACSSARPRRASASSRTGAPGPCAIAFPASGSRDAAAAPRLPPCESRLKALRRSARPPMSNSAAPAADPDTGARPAVQLAELTAGQARPPPRPSQSIGCSESAGRRQGQSSSRPPQAASAA